ncbi:MAG: 4Fe-4S ferredoxin [Acidobacteriota bacterium]|nr:4Fe-4S ferredoxin [Acidobacteriota bacterium]
MSDAQFAVEGQTIERQTMEVDIACVGFGPAMGGFLTTLTREMAAHPDDPALQSRVMPGMPLQVLCYERADDLAAGVSGVVTAAKAIRQSFPELVSSAVPMLAPVKNEKVLYLLDPLGASKRSVALKAGDLLLRGAARDHAYELPFTPEFLNKHDGLVLSIGQFNQWVANEVMMTGMAQLWPGSPVSEALIEGDAVKGVRLADQGVLRDGAPDAGYMPGMDVHAALTVVGDGPVGPVGQSLDRHFGMPFGNQTREWALGMKMVVELPEDTPLTEGTVWHTFGFPEPEIFGFLYVHPERLASVGIFVPSWLKNPQRTAYRTLQHYIQHPYLWRYLKNAQMRSWSAKSLAESGTHGEPYLCGNGYARIGEGSGSTNMLTGSGVDEAWATGMQLAEATLELLREGREFTQENLQATYVARRRLSSVEQGVQQAKNARNGFQTGVVTGLIGMGLAGLTNGKLAVGGNIPRADQQIAPLEQSFSAAQLEKARAAVQQGALLQDALMDATGWPPIEYDGRILVSHQDALLMGGKVQAAPGFADHVLFRDPALCEPCRERTCIAMCSGQAITEGDGRVPAFDREKCVHCGACLWNCAHSTDGKHTNVDFRAGAGGFHSAEN